MPEDISRKTKLCW